MIFLGTAVPLGVYFRYWIRHDETKHHPSTVSIPNRIWESFFICQIRRLRMAQIFPFESASRKVHRTMSDRAGTGIERIPVELWHAIFQYFALNGLWYSFRGLNSRIDAIVDQTPLDLNLLKRGALARFLDNSRLSINLANVRSLLIQDPVENTKFFSIYSLTSFLQLRTRTLYYISALDDPTFQFWKQRSSLKHLQSLTVSLWPLRALEDAIGDLEFLIRSISNHGLCPALKSFELAMCDSGTPRTFTPQLMPAPKAIDLRHVSINCLTLSDLVALFPAMQNVQSLRIDRRFWADEEWMQNPLKIDTTLLSKCKLLRLEFDEKLTFEHVEYLLGRITNLRTLFLTGPQQLIVAKKLEVLLSKYCPRLVVFHLVSIGQMTDESFRNALVNFKEDCYASSFWLDRDVALIIDNSNQSTSDRRSEFIVGFDIRNR